MISRLRGRAPAGVGAARGWPCRKQMGYADVVYDSGEAIEARSAFLEKRAPDFSRFR